MNYRNFEEYWKKQGESRLYEGDTHKEGAKRAWNEAVRACENVVKLGVAR